MIVITSSRETTFPPAGGKRNFCQTPLVQSILVTSSGQSIDFSLLTFNSRKSAETFVPVKHCDSSSDILDSSISSDTSSYSGILPVHFNTLPGNSDSSNCHWKTLPRSAYSPTSHSFRLLQDNNSSSSQSNTLIVEESSAESQSKTLIEDSNISDSQSRTLIGYNNSSSTQSRTLIGTVISISPLKNSVTKPPQSNKAEPPNRKNSFKEFQARAQKKQKLPY